MRRRFTISYGFHGDASGVLPVALLVQLNDGLPSVLLRRVKGVQAALMSAQLLHCSRSKRVTGRDQHGETVLNQPVRNLQKRHIISLCDIIYPVFIPNSPLPGW